MIPSQIPRHVAVIMDGNGRWAQKRGRPRVYGHIRGASRIESIVKEADRLGVRALTLFAFSTENWSRPGVELQVLWRLLKKYLKREVDHLDRENVRLRVIGEIGRLDPELQSLVVSAVDKLSSNTGLQLSFAISYGSQREIVDAARCFAQDCVSRGIDPSQLDEKHFEKYLWTATLGEFSNVDLVIRTSGEKRISNFLLWQSAYAEYYFTDVLWPDFNPECFRLAVAEYTARERRFGGVRGINAPQGLVT